MRQKRLVKLLPFLVLVFISINGLYFILFDRYIPDSKQIIGSVLLAINIAVLLFKRDFGILFAFFLMFLGSLSAISFDYYTFEFHIGIGSATSPNVNFKILPIWIAHTYFNRATLLSFWKKFLG